MAAAPAIAGTHHWISCLYTNPPSHSCMPYQARGVATTIAIKTSFIKSIDSRFTMVLTVFASVAILVSCLGLFGLATYTAQVKLKEIGIRKVLGASVANITAMLSKDFLMLVLISLVISSPIAWFAMNNWLVGVCICRRLRLTDCFCYHQFPGHTGCIGEPGEKPAFGVMCRCADMQMCE
jgi:hypothetical protein